MTNFTTKIYVGIDISQAVLDVYISKTNQYLQVQNNALGISKLIKILNNLIVNNEEIFVGMEATSGLQRNLLIKLQETTFKVFVINPERVWGYRRSLGKRAKTDKIDSRLIAEYVEKIKPRESVSYSSLQNELKELSARRMQYSDMIAKEKTRLRRFLSESARDSITRNIKYLNAEMLTIIRQLRALVRSDVCLLNKYKLLYSIPGIGEIVALTIISEIPEIGLLENSEISSLAGVAPMIRESGVYKGKSRIHGGRNKIRAVLYMAAFNAMMCNDRLKTFAARLKAKGKVYKVIIVAVMRKLLTYANAITRTNIAWNS